MVCGRCSPAEGPSAGISLCGRNFVGVDVEHHLLLAPLLYAELPFTLGHKRAAGTDKLTGADVEADAQRAAGQFQTIVAIDLNPLVVATQVYHMILVIAAVGHQLGIAHDMRHDIVAGLVGESACGLRQPWRHEVPDSTSDASFMRIDGAPHLVEHAAAVACYGYIFVHERGSHVAVPVSSHPEVKGQRSGVARPDNVFSWMTIGVAAIHPPAGVVIFASFGNHLADVGSLAALVACAPEEHGGLVAVAQHHAAHTLTVHRYEALVA